MRGFVPFDGFTDEEAVLTKVHAEAFETFVSEIAKDKGRLEEL